MLRKHSPHLAHTSSYTYTFVTVFLLQIFGRWLATGPCIWCKNHPALRMYILSYTPLSWVERFGDGRPCRTAPWAAAHLPARPAADGFALHCAAGVPCSRAPSHARRFSQPAVDIMCWQSGLSTLATTMIPTAHTAPPTSSPGPDPRRPAPALHACPTHSAKLPPLEAVAGSLIAHSHAILFLPLIFIYLHFAALC